MAVVNWRRVLAEAGIEYVERGPNVKKGELGIQCPFCGAADHSQHMNLNLENGWWRCWRNKAEHSGKSPVRLLVKLLGVTYERARDMAGLGESYTDPDGFTEVAARLMARGAPVATVESRAATPRLKFPDEFIRIDANGRTARFWDYLVGRDFIWEDIPYLCQDYSLWAAVRGDFKDRVILPYIVDTKLVTWSGRAIADATIRYKDLATDIAGVTAKSLLYNYDCHRCHNRKVLAVVEGPFDAIKLDFYGKDQGVRAVALSTNDITEEQVYELETMAPEFGRVIVMLDTATQLGLVDSMRLKSRLSQIRGLEIAPVPFGKKDCGELTPREVFQYTRGLKI